MARATWVSFVIISSLTLLHPPTATNAHRLNGFLVDSIYQFGNSLSDTGNLVRLVPNLTVCNVSPYGETFFGHPASRCSDGLLMVDFIAKRFGLPFLNPYLDATADFTQGVDFSIAGATALSAAALEAKNVTALSTVINLPTELDWFKTYLQSVCSNPIACRAKLTKSLFMMGEIGGNDINFLFVQGKSIELAYTLIPDIVEAIKNATQEIIKLGAIKIIIPGNLPIGCLPVFLWNNASNDTSAYDDLKCLKSFNVLVQFQNEQIQKAIGQLQEQNPSVIIAYGDYYNAYIWLLKNVASLGFEKDQDFNPCCGSSSISCGTEGGPLCANPKTRLSWDGIHPTHQANKYLAKWILGNIKAL